MDKDAFQRKYHFYAVDSFQEAALEARKVNSEVEGFEVVVYGPLLGKYCLMLRSASEFVDLLKLFEET